MSFVQRYYLDTSAQYERQGGLTQTRLKLDKALRGGQHATSTQVLREWNRAVFNACVALRKALSEAKDFTDVVRSMTQGFGRTGSRNWQITHWITKSDTTDLAVVEKRLDDFQRIRARVMFNFAIDTVRDGTDCDVARRRPHFTAGKWQYHPTCKKTDNICEQPGFLKTNMERARAAAKALEASDRPNDARMGKNAMKALDAVDDNATKGNGCHAAHGLGGDICIALECASDEILLTTDASFDVICPALGIEHERL